MGGSYQTHGSPFDKNFPTGASPTCGRRCDEPAARDGPWLPTRMSQSNVGVKIKEPIAPGGWSFVSRDELAFDPYSGLLANAPQAMQNAIHVRRTSRPYRSNSSRWGWLARQIICRREPADLGHSDLRPAKHAVDG